jgi:hypothetical protein
MSNAGAVTLFVEMLLEFISLAPASEQTRFSRRIA